MRKYLLFLFVLCIGWGTAFAQRDTEHWFAPMKAGETISGFEQALFFSTDSTTPFPVNIYSNNVLLGTVTVSKGSPQQFDLSEDDIIATDVADCFTVKGRGLYVQGTKPFYATLRFSVPSHGEIVTSKGKAGIGKLFYTPLADIRYDLDQDNFTVGILATEDNTTVTVSGYKPNVQFTNGTSGNTNPTMTFTLNKGQSYLIEGSATVTANRTGFIGAKIEATKPISVTSGHFTGNFANTSNFTGTDIIMDQAVPVERLGDRFVLIKGYGDITQHTEGAIIIATENNTEIRINGNPTPVATINAGGYYRVLSNFYQNKGNNHYNMLIETSKNVYVYQLLNGVSGTSNNQEGYNYIPPLNCYLPRKIDELGLVNVMPGASLTPTVKLNILTEAGANIKVNGVTPPAVQGPYPVTGSTGWVTYSIPNVSGNYTITSDLAVTAGIAAGSGAMGYGGYFAGFSSIPAIAKSSGDCIPGLVLEVDSEYTSYQWNLNGTPIPGANSYTYTPTVGGVYTCTVKQGTCAPVVTPPYNAYSCLYHSTMDITACSTVQIKPTFTMNTTQTPVPSTVVITQNPANGVASVDPVTGVVSYSPNSSFIGNDSFKFKFCGNNTAFPDCEEITVNVTVPPYPVVKDQALTECYNPANPVQGIFNLKEAAVTTETGVTIKYYLSLADAQNGTNEITNPANYLTPATVVYAKVINNGGCFNIAKITLNVTPPTYSTVLKDISICMEDRATLDAGPGFTYLWNTGATTQTITGVTIGEYWVDLTKNGCTTRQYVKVYKNASPVVTGIDISNNTVTLTVGGGQPPYEYSADGIQWGSSNTFSNLPRGHNTFYIRDSNDCDPIAVAVTVPNLVNTITPNGDGINDTVDYSALGYKNELTMNIFDRYGAKIFEANSKNGYRWDGKLNGKAVPSGTYWYEVKWNEGSTEAPLPVKFAGWILVKN